MVYLESLYLPNDDFDYEFRIKTAPSDVIELYPWGMFENRKPDIFTFSDITIFYGGNGSGKSTLLNFITQKLELARNALFNSSPLFDEYLKYCRCDVNEDYNSKMAIKRGSIITSDDVFKHILGIRERLRAYEEKRLQFRDDYVKRKFTLNKQYHIDFTQSDYMDAVNDMRADTQAKKGSLKKYVNSRVTQITSKSNGENALKYFIDTILPESLTLLDEPENSLSPQWQAELAQYLWGCARAEGCQLIIASHSPFFLSIPGAKVYNLDEDPIKPQEWYKLENMQWYFELFEQNKDKFSHK